MGNSLYWLVGLGIAMASYGVYRLVFLKKSKPPHQSSRHYTLKIETD